MRFGDDNACICLPVGFVVLVTCMVDCPHPKALSEIAGVRGDCSFSILLHSGQAADLKLIVALYKWWTNRILKAIFIVMHNVDS